jgi:spore maturation protein CgeB
MRVLLFETTAYYPASPLFLEALQRLAADSGGSLQYDFVDEADFHLPSGGMGRRLARRVLGRRPFDLRALNERLLNRAQTFKPDLVLICKGATVAPHTLAVLKAQTGATLINFATDDPFNPRVSTPELVRSIPFYDIYACTKLAIMEDVMHAGCQRAMYLPFAYKPDFHFPEHASTIEEHRQFDSAVAFVGGCDGDRVLFFCQLLAEMPTLDLALYGSYWNRCLSLRRHWRGFAVGRDFRLALGGAKIAINLVRRANRDGHVMRSFEIPACGAFMLAERTHEHDTLFADGINAAFFSSVTDACHQIQHYLANPQERARITQAGLALVSAKGQHDYTSRLITILDTAKSFPLVSSHRGSL